MLTLRSIRIALAILCSLFMFGMVKSSLAIEIVDFPSNTEDTSYNGYTYHMAYVKTDVPIYSVIWYIDDVIAYSETLNSTTKNASYFPCYDPTSSAKIPGSIKGKKYDIGVKVWEWDADDEEFRSTTASYTVRMFEPIYLYKRGEHTGAWGSVEISSFAYNGSHIVMSAYAHASNPSNNPKAGDRDKFPLTVLPWFWTQKYPAPDGNAEDELRSTKDSETIDLGESSQYHYPGTLTDPDPKTGKRKPFNRDVGTLEEGDAHYFKAHAHLQVYGARTLTDNWEVDTQQQTGTAAVTFTWEDGP